MAKNRLALVALLAGIAAFFNLFGLEKGILAIAIGWMALGEIKQDPELTRGEGLAWAGIILGALSIVLILGLILFKGPQILQYLRHLPKFNGR